MMMESSRLLVPNMNPTASREMLLLGLLGLRVEDSRASQGFPGEACRVHRGLIELVKVYEACGVLCVLGLLQVKPSTLNPKP